MGSRLTKELLQGIVVPDERITLENIAAASSYTEQGPRPGVPVADDPASTLRPIVTGSQVADVRAGIVRAGGVGKAEIAYRLDSEGATDWRGWSFPSAPVWSHLLSEDRTGANEIVAFDCVTEPNSQDVLSAYVNSDGDLYFVRWSSTTWIAASTVTIATDITYGRQTQKACAIQIQTTGRIVAWAGAVSYYSDDAGATWGRYSEGAYDSVTSAPSTFTYKRVIRVGGDYCAVWFDSGDDVYQYGSTDQGQTWIDVGAKVDLGSYIDAAEMPDGSAYLIYVDASSNVKTIRLTGAFQSIGDLASSALTVATGTYASCAIAADPNGDLYAYARASDQIEGYKLIDGAWVRMTTGLADFQDTANAPTMIAACCTYGAVMMVTDGNPANASIAGNPNHLRGTLCGGYSTLVADHTGSLVVAPGYETDDAVHYQAIAVPDAGSAWTVALSGGSAAINANGLSLTNPSIMYKHEFTSSSLDLGLVCEWGLAVVAAAPVLYEPTPGLVLRASTTATTGYILNIVYRTDTIYVYDVNTTTVLITVSTDTTVERLYHCSITASGAVTFASRAKGATVWSIATATATSDTIANSNSSVQFGNAAGPGSVDSYWQYVQARAFRDTLDGQLYWVHGQGSLVGRPLNGIPTPVPVIGDDGTQAAYLHAEGGDAADQAPYTISAAHDYPIENTLPQVSPSPSVGWRSTSTAEQSIIWDLGSSTVARSYLGKAMAIYLDGCNFGYCEVETSLDGASWTGIATMKFGTGLGAAAAFGYSLTGDVLTFTSGEADRYIFGETMRDYHVELIDGRATKARKIAANLSGQLGVTGTTSRPAVRLDAIDGTEAATGTCVILSKRCLSVAYDTSLQTTRYVRIRIPASQEIAGPSGETGYHIGSIVLGEFLAFGGGTGTGWTDTTAPNYDEAITRRGTRYRRSLGPPSRRWSLVFDEFDRFLDSTSPDYISNNGTDQPLAARAEIYEQLRAIAVRTSALAVPVVAVRYLTAGDGSIVYPSAILYGHISGEVELQQVTGDNDWSAQQVIRAGNIQIDEVI